MARKKDSSQVVDSPMGYIVSGLIVQLLGGFAVGLGVEQEDSLIIILAALVTTVGGIITLVGVIAAGVALGLKLHDFERRP